MNAILRFYPSDEAALFALNVLVQVTAAGLLAWFAQRFLRKTSAPTRHGVYLAALVWMMLSPLTAYVCQRAGIVWVAISVSEAEGVAEPKRIMQAPVDERPPSLEAVPDLVEPTEPPTSMPAISPLAAEPPGPQPPPGLSWEEMLRLAVTVAFFVWGLGVLYFLARLIHGLRRLACLRREVQPIQDERLDAVRAQVSQALGVTELPLLVASEQVGSPIAIGILQPMVVLPQDLVGVLDDRQLREVLIHECAHVLRRDHVVGLLQRLAEMLFWPHPLVYLLNHELAQAREEVCDNHVLLASNGPDYARTLLALAVCTTSYHDTPATSGLLGPRWRLEDRVAGLLNQGRKRMIRMNRIPALGVAVLFMTAALAMAGTRWTGAPPSQLPASETTELAPDAEVSLVLDKLEKKGENPKPIEFTIAGEKPAGVPDSANGLSISVKPAKASFALKEQLSFTVSFKNVSKKPLLLYDIDQTMSYKVEFSGFPTGGPWIPQYNLNHQAARLAPMPSDSRELAPGATLDRQVVLNGVHYAFRGNQLAAPVPKEYLDAGKYRVTVGIQLKMNPAKADWKTEHWIGEIAAQSPEFVIVGKEPPGGAVVVKGLSVAATTKHRVFPGNVIPHFKVRFENVSGKDLSLLGYQVPNWTLHIKNKDTGLVQTWKHVPLAGAPVMPHLVLAAGKSHEEEVVLHPESFYLPPKKGAAGPIELGNYEIVCEIHLRESPDAREIIPAYWVGQIRTVPLEFTVGDGAAKGR